MLRLSSLLCAAAFVLAPVTVGLLCGHVLTSAAPLASGPAPHVILAQFNPCPNGKCRR